ncbi:MAG: hypothetical protein KKH02_06590 [Proteobacteria bacterium]|nr:hypothetical protein [Pseudomonadota bacterium]
MENQPANNAQVIQETFYDMALYMEALFALYGINGILADDIIHCIDKGYIKAMKNLKGSDPAKPPIRRKGTVDRFLRKLEQEVKR